MFSPLRIKVCGMRDRTNIAELCELGPDFIGYIFYPGSKRYVGDRPDPEIFNIAGPSIKKVGVFVDEDNDQILRKIERYRLDMVQLHGKESPDYCFRLAEHGISMIKVFSPLRTSASHNIGDYIELVKYILFDTPGESFGGSGEKFNWELIMDYSIPFPFLLSGGIAPEDAETVKAIQHDWLYAVDVNSRFEISPGMKNIDQVKNFIEKVRN